MLSFDHELVKRMLNNLISNALKFTDSGRVVVRVSARWQEQRCWLQWQVADTGIGIASEHQAHLFEPFFQANPGTDAMRGTGLGLAICAHLVALMEGQLRVVSESGLGSSFSVELPLPAAPLAPEHVQQVAPLEHGQRRVVINPPPHGLSEAEMDAVHGLPYTRKPHPALPILSSWAWVNR